MSTTDYYQTLGVFQNASDSEIKSAYRKLAMKYHPDRNAGDKEAESKFKDVNTAYETLKDNKKRKLYDSLGHDAYVTKAETGGFNTDYDPFASSFKSPFTSSPFENMDFSDVFSSIFGDLNGTQHSEKGYKERGEDIRYDLNLSLEEAYQGVEKEITIATSTQCEHCHGHGTADGKAPHRCATCRGKGTVHTKQQGSFFVFETTCPQCRGSGYGIPAQKCTSCKGTGKNKIEKTLKIKIPAGIEDGTRMRVSGEGQAGKSGGGFGDLYVFISVKEHTLYEREGSDLYTIAPISMAMAALGGNFNLKGIDGEDLEIEVKAGTQPGDKIRIKNKGMSRIRTEARGDLYVVFKVMIPTKLTDEQKECLRKFEKEAPAEEQGFWSKLFS